MKLRINRTNWNVYLVDRYEDEPGVLGKTSYIKGTIEIVRGMSSEKTKSTIIHEIVHAYLDSYGFELPNVESVMLFSEEQLCEFIAMNGEEIMSIADRVYRNLVSRV